MNISNILRRCERADEALENSGTPGRDIEIHIEYYDTVIDQGGARRDVPMPATYADVEWNQVEPDANGNRTVVQYPNDEGLE